MSAIYIDSDNVVTLSKLRDGITGTYANSATVTGRVLYADGEAVADSSFTLTYASASNGIYRGTIPDTVTELLTLGASYYVEVTVVSGGNQVVFRQLFEAGYVTGA